MSQANSAATTTLPSDLRPVSRKKAKEGGRRIVKFRAPSQIHHIPGFAHIIHAQRRFNIKHIFSRALLPSGNGFPVWNPTASTIVPTPKEYHLDGISIGDVGILGDYGTFDFRFNIFLPADHPFNKAGIPKSFVPLAPPDASEIRKVPHVFPPGFMMTSQDMNFVRNPQNPKDISFESSAPQGAVLILPDGATREDMITTGRIHDYVKKYAHDWYNSFGPTVMNGALYVVTGTDKASSRAAFAYPYHDLPERECTDAGVTLSYTNGHLRQTNRENQGETSEYTAVPKNTENLCIFLRGIRLALNGSDWVKLKGDERIDVYSELYEAGAPFMGTLGASNVQAAEEESHSDLSNSLESDISSLDNDHRDSDSDEFHDPMYFMRSHPLHPSDLVAQILLCEYPETPLVLLDDNIWSSWPHLSAKSTSDVLTTVRCSGTSIPDLCALLTHIFCLHDVVEQDGVITLMQSSKTMIPGISWVKIFRDFVFGSKPVGQNWANDAIRELLRQGQQHLFP